jgi:carboxyl-terminal processing protease
MEPFAKQVVLITNDRTVSAADVFALMMSELPNVTIIGEPTNGSYSDIYSKKLPNGWRII